MSVWKSEEKLLIFSLLMKCNIKHSTLCPSPDETPGSSSKILRVRLMLDILLLKQTKQQQREDNGKLLIYLPSGQKLQSQTITARILVH